MRKIAEYWNSGLEGKLVTGCGIGVIMFLASFCCLFLVLAAIGSISPTPPTEVVSNQNEEGWLILPGPSANNITFAGKVVNQNSGEWVNHRLVLAFLNSKEIARTVTDTVEYDGTTIFDKNGESSSTRLDGGLGVADGIFVINIPNTYELHPEYSGLPNTEFPFVWAGGKHGTTLGAWLDPFYEGDFREFYIPSKNIRYILMALPGDLSQLPAEIQQPGSVKLLEGNRLIAIDPNAPEPTSQSFSGTTRFEQVTESVNQLPNSAFPINNCGGATDITQEISHTYIHEIIDETNEKLGIEIPILDWLNIVAEVGRKYGTTDKEITTYSTTVIVPAGKNVEYTILRKQVWESGVAIMENAGIEISAAYRILKNEVFEVANSEQRPCP